ncbi:MAG: DUF1295 domain-containing protein [Cyanobacteria bacterium P01_A01_bin.17]
MIALPVLSGWSYLAIISPLFVALLLTKVSGINLLDAIAIEDAISGRLRQICPQIHGLALSQRQHHVDDRLYQLRQLGGREHQI